MAVPSEPIPFNDLARSAVAQRPALLEAFERVVDSGWFVMGPEHDAFEREFADYLSVAHAIGVGNGTDALELALGAVGVGTGGRVLTVANAGGYTTTATRRLGAEPLYCDIDPVSYQIDPESVRAALEDGPLDAIVVTHLFGTAAPVREIVALASAHGVPVVEDCAESIGAQVDGTHLGNFGAIGANSFYPTKNLGALGDGGAVITNDDELATVVRRRRQYGWESKYRQVDPGGRNSRLDEVQAAFLRLRLPLLAAANERRREIHRRYEAAITAPVRLVNRAGPGYVGHLAILDVDDRDAVREQLLAAGIRTDVHFPIPDHQQPVMAGRTVPSLPVTERAVGRILSLPLFPELRDDEVDRIVAALEGLR
jgi:dTDP-3-amino-2,3,6-trideoxy-4-keto-D-glucose/dTDP-3-amino-3,4,6-trideoxy-alpha-D-glucose/dTDP-2,6-dideoxy-D-kanosamine transaminase